MAVWTEQLQDRWAAQDCSLSSPQRAAFSPPSIRQAGQSGHLAVGCDTLTGLSLTTTTLQTLNIDQLSTSLDL